MGVPHKKKEESHAKDIKSIQIATYKTTPKPTLKFCRRVKTHKLFVDFLVTFNGGGENIKEKNRTLGFIDMVWYRSRFFIGQPQKPKQPQKPNIKNEG